MSGISFLNALFLAGLGTVTIPILIHLLFKRQKKQVVFSSLRFLRKVTEEKAKRLRLREWLLLAMRILIFVLFALAFARPFFEDSSATAVAARSDAVLVLDNSYSMAARAGEASVFEIARGKALEAIKQLRPGDRAALVTTCGGGVIEENLTEDLDRVQAAVSRASPASQFCRYWSAVKRGHSLLASSDRARRLILFFTDGQLCSWEGMNEARGLEGLGKSILLETILTGDVEIANVALLDARVPAKVWSQEEPLKVVAKVANYSRRPTPKLKLRLAWHVPDPASPAAGPVKNEQIVEKTFRLEPQEVASVPILFQPSQKADVAGWIDVEADDSLPIDNRFFFSISAEDAIRVLCVEEAIARKPFLQATYYLRRALQPASEKEAAPPGYVRTQLITSDLLASTDLKDFHVVVLANVFELSPEATDRIEAFVQAGGGLVVFPGGNIQESFYNEKGYRDGAGWLPAEFQTRTGDNNRRERFWTFVPVDRGHELFRPYSGEDWTELSSARFYRYLVVHPAPASKTLAVYDNDAPAILESKVGRGCVILFTSTCDSEWTDLPKRGIFLPLAHQLVRYLAPRDRESRSQLLVEEPLSASFGNSRSFLELETLAARDDKGHSFPLASWVPEPGLYTILNADRTRALRTVAANLNTRESNPARVDLAEIAGLSGASEAPAGNVEATGRVRWEERAFASPWWRYLLLAVLALLLLELLVANWPFE